MLVFPHFHNIGIPVLYTLDKIICDPASQNQQKVA